MKPNTKSAIHTSNEEKTAEDNEEFSLYRLLEVSKKATTEEIVILDFSLETEL
jgi:hypothetical protein